MIYHKKLQGNHTMMGCTILVMLNWQSLQILPMKSVARRRSQSRQQRQCLTGTARASLECFVEQ
jgi:hypothetical protein